ncbi:MAG: ABC transporter permease [Vicinamibacterales bacterium]
MAPAPHEREEEIRAHLELYVEQLVAEGRTPEEARREARLRFGNPRAKLEEISDMSRLPIVDALWRDLKYGVRVLRRSPAFTVTAVLTLALAIGANAAVFSLAHSLLLAPLPYPEPDRLAMVVTHYIGADGAVIDTDISQDGRQWEAARDRVPSIDAAVLSGGGSGVNMILGETAVIARQQRVSAGYFRVLGVAPLVGREFQREEDVPNGPAVTILSYRLWQRAYGGKPDILGQTVFLRGEPYAVIGVMPEGFESWADPDLWTPLRPSTRGEGGGTNYEVIARLRPGVTWAQAAGELASLSTPDLFESRGRPREGVMMVEGLEPMQQAMATSYGLSQPIVMLAVSVGIVLLVACVNLAALLLARGAGRVKEIATRMALGSGRRAVVRQLMVEAAIIAVLGGAIGLGVGYVGLEWLKDLGSDVFGEWDAVSLDGTVVAVTLLASLVTSVLFGLVPALQASRIRVQAAMTDGGSRSIAGSARHWPRRLLVVAEVALGVVLLVSAGLLIRTFVQLRGLDPGFDPDGLVTTTASMQDKRYESAERVNRLFDDTLRRLEATPGIEAASVSLELPYARLLNLGFAMPDDPDLTRTITNAMYVTPGFLDTFRIPLRDGRAFTDRDRIDTPPVAVVNQTWVRIYSPQRPAIGRRIAIMGEEREIVGVMGDVQQTQSFRLDEITPGPIVSLPLVLVPASQTTDAALRTLHTWFWPVWTVRARSASVAAEALRTAIRESDPMLPIDDITTMDQVMARATSRQRLLMTLAALLAGAALLLSAIGIHGLIAHAVQERRREFGIRLALGATPAGTMRAVAGGGILLAAIGAMLGGLLSIPATRLVEAFLWGVTERDPATYAAVAGFMLLVAGVASVVPSLRILRLDPAETLRE